VYHMNDYSAFQSGLVCRVFVITMSYYSAFQSRSCCRCICVLYCSAFQHDCGVVVIEFNYCSVFQSGLCCACICVSYQLLFSISESFALQSICNNRNELLFHISNQLGLCVYFCII
jgi:hypothetical protein